jgi:hypothetical protein
MQPDDDLGGRIVERCEDGRGMSLAYSVGMKNLSRASCALLIGLAGVVGGCAEGSAALQRSEAQPQQKASPQSQRNILNEGYSILYSDLDDLSKADLIFLVKSETKPVEEVTTAVTEYAAALKRTLDRVAKDYPAVDIALDPMPVMEQRKRGAITKDRLSSFAPVAGLRGESFDRRMLQTLEGALNQLRFLTKALADEEPEPSLKQIATTAHNRFEELYGRVVAILDEKYYINTGERKVAKEAP